MNDRIFLFFFAYLLIASVSIATLPDSFFTGTSPSSIDVDDLTGEIETNPASLSTQVSFFGKVLRFMFVPIVIDGIPTLLGLIFQLFHVVIFATSTIYFYKLVRGI